MHVNEDSPWNRHGYPLQASNKGSKARNLLAQVDHEPPSDQLSQHPKTISNGTSPAYRDAYRVQSPRPIDQPIVPLLSALPQTETSNQASSQLEDASNVEGTGQGIRSTYPVQSPAQNRLLQSCPISVMDSHSSPSQISENHLNRVPNHVQSLNRTSYPLQSTVEDSDMKESPVSLSNGQHKPPVSDVVNSDLIKLSQEGEHWSLPDPATASEVRVAEETDKWTRNGYPLPSSAPDRIMKSWSMQPSVEEGKTTQLEGTENDHGGTTGSMPDWSSKDHLVHSSEGASIPGSWPIIPEEEEARSSDQLEESRKWAAVTDTKVWNRQTYPLHKKPSAHVLDSNSSLHKAPLDQALIHNQVTNSTQIAGTGTRKSYPLNSKPSVHFGDGTTPLSEEPSNSKITHSRNTASVRTNSTKSTYYPLNKQPSIQALTSKKYTVSHSTDTQNTQSPTSSLRNRQSYPLNQKPSVQLRKDDPDLAHSTAVRNEGRHIYPLNKQPSLNHLLPAVVSNQESRYEGNQYSDSIGQDKQSTTLQNIWNRPTYPLQHDTRSSKHTSTPPILPDRNSQDVMSAEQAWKGKVNLDEEDRKNLQSHPSQSTTHSSTAQLPTPPLSEKSEDRFEAQNRPRGPIYLPRHIRAAKEGDKYEATGRTIVLCLDGTGDKFDDDNSNIVHLVSALKKDDPSQVTYYQSGIGTYGKGGLSHGFDAALDMAVGSGLGLHVRDAYRFVMHTYKEGDKICIFGFSRGAYTARCLAGMIHKVGLLPPRNVQQIEFAYQFYANDTEQGWEDSFAFKKAFCIDVNVYFLGVFDSVASVGFIPRTLPLSSTPTSKSYYFRHAMALDERRAKFKVCRHQFSGAEEESRYRHMFHSHTKEHDVPPENLTQKPHEKYRISRDEEPFDTNVEEVWFAGAHADVGGGAVKNTERHKLAQIPLRWLIRQCFETNTGIIFKSRILAEFGMDVHMMWPKYHQPRPPVNELPASILSKHGKGGLLPRQVRKSRLVLTDKHQKGEPLYDLQIFNEEHKDLHDREWTPEHVEDIYDSVSSINDQLVDAPSWWILEFWPVSYKMFKPTGEMYEKVGMNLGRYRAAEEQAPKIHWTVLHRMRKLGYKINARTREGTEWIPVA